ncbi:SseB protein C-terminal domain-containing protein [Amphibacillus marinus]|uniref:SseB protein C-terminal domain-containing protein n=1 Tax=Amphibacillus marinus TaxID=872970 RepID=A0A1H8TZI6_9BACI|nr:enhanced serine sensitivity protein SseB C-terminal domain-containing protein [Amphibacillus marinus]SEO96275.1 SseB protein C-terminal domain-containing protein [Amphibacillus marinus]
MNINKPLKNEKLNSIIEQLKATNSVESETNFLKYLKKSTLLIPIIKDNSDENTNISILNLQQTNGDNYIPLFTEWVDLKGFPNFEHVDGWLVEWKDYQKLLFDNPLWNGVVINLNSYNVILNRDNMRSIGINVFIEDINTIVKKYLDKDMFLDIMPLEDSFSKQAIQDVSPFYTVK